MSLPFGSDSYEVIARLSNSEPKIMSDKKASSLYGFALGILDDTGKQIVSMPMINLPVFPTQSVTAVLKLVQAIEVFYML